MHLLLSARSRRKIPSTLILTLAVFATLLSLVRFYKQLNAPVWTRSEYREVQHDTQLVQYATVLETNTLVLQPVVTRAVLIVFHRCGQSPLHWWHSSPGCRECQGLPEQMAILRAALQRGMGVMALQSSSRRTHCWDTHHPQRSRDMPEVLREVKRVERLQGWQGLPRFAIGNSEGGAMALILARSLELKGVCSQVMGIPPSQLEEQPSTGGNNWRFPPTVFVHMSRDKTTAAWIEQDIKVLQQQGVPTKEIRVDDKVLSKQYFSDRISGMNVNVSSAIYSALHTAQLIDSRGHLIKDPRPHAADWKQAIHTIGPGNLSYLDMLGLQQELNVAWGGHEITADPIESVLDWFERPTGPKTQLKMHTTFLPARTVPVDESALP